MEDSVGTIAVSELNRLSRIGCEQGPEALRDTLREAVIPLTLARGAYLERSEWETRIEAAALECDRAAARHAIMAESAYRSGRAQGAAGEQDIADQHSSEAKLLRSLLTVEGNEKPQGLEALSGTKREWNESDEAYLDALSGEGPGHPGSSPDVPAELRVQAVKAVYEALMEGHFGSNPRARMLGMASRAVRTAAPLLVEHGRIEGKSEAWGEVYRSPGIQRLEREAEARGVAQERVRWETRIEREQDLQARFVADAAERDTSRARERHVYAESLLHSLLNKEEK